jgi:hypothetical protein
MRLLVGLAFGFVFSAPASAVLSAGDVFERPNSPLSVKQGDLENNFVGNLFVEKWSTNLANDVALDAANSGLYDDLSDLTTVNLAKGTNVSVWLLHIDRIAGTGNRAFTGSITFDDPIYGVVVRTARLNATDSLGAFGTSYPGTAAEQMGRSFGLAHGSFSISADRKTIEFDSFLPSAGWDQMRIFAPGMVGVQAVPEPATLLVLGAGLGLLARRNKNKPA